MTATAAPAPWPAPPSSPDGPAWRFGRAIGAGWRFELRRNLSITPRQLLAAYALLCAFALAVATGFWTQGVRMVVMFTGLELLAVGAALWVAARHAGDRELITLDARTVRVERHVGQRVETVDFRAEWLRVEPAAADGSLVELSGQGLHVRIGRHVRPEWRAQLARELRRALGLVRGRPVAAASAAAVDAPSADAAAPGRVGPDPESDPLR